MITPTKKRYQLTRADIGRAAQAKLEALLDDQECLAHPADLSMLACIVWFDEISERIRSSARVSAFVKPLIYSLSTPLFNPERVCSWLVTHFGYSQEFALARVGARETYRTDDPT